MVVITCACAVCGYSSRARAVWASLPYPVLSYPLLSYPIPIMGLVETKPRCGTQVGTSHLNTPFASWQHPRSPQTSQSSDGTEHTVLNETRESVSVK